jgi:hypothetical protein
MLRAALPESVVILSAAATRLGSLRTDAKNLSSLFAGLFGIVIPSERSGFLRDEGSLFGFVCGIARLAFREGTF